MPKTTAAIFLAFVLAALAVGVGAAAPVGYEWHVVNGVGVHVVKIDLNDSRVRVTPAIAARGRGSCESLGSFINRTRPTAAVTGTFFDVRSLLPVGDIAINGQLIHQGHLNRGICVGRANDISFKRVGRTDAWFTSIGILCSGPRLLTDGKITLSPRDEGFRDRALFRRARRTAVGLTGNNKLVLVAVNTPVYLRTLAAIMQHIGCTEAINLDGGASSALYYRGKTLAKPGRSLTNMLLVYENRSLYEQHIEQLAPTWFKKGTPQPTCARGPATAP